MKLLELHTAEEQTKIDDEFINQCISYILKTAGYDGINHGEDVVNMMLNSFKLAFYELSSWVDDANFKGMVEEICRRLDSIKM